jgi:chromosome segregation ATPase
MNVKVNLGNKINNYENLIQETNSRILELTHLIVEKDKEILKIKAENELLNKNFLKMNAAFKDTQNENKELKIEIKSINEELQNMEIKFDELVINNKEGSNANNILKDEIEVLTNIINEKKVIEYNYKVEVIEGEKIRAGFENKIIELTKINEELMGKVYSFENIIKQKEKYINMMLKTREVSTTYENNTQRKNSSIIFSPQNITFLQNKLHLAEEKIKTMEGEIKKMENEKNNLMIRIRNKKI